MSLKHSATINVTGWISRPLSADEELRLRIVKGDDINGSDSKIITIDGTQEPSFNYRKFSHVVDGLDGNEKYTMQYFYYNTKWGFESLTTREYTYTIKGPNVTILGDTNNDGVINQQELSQVQAQKNNVHYIEGSNANDEQVLLVEIQLPQYAQQGENIQIESNGATLSTIVISEQDIADGKIIVALPVRDGNKESIVAKWADSEGNLSLSSNIDVATVQIGDALNGVKINIKPVTGDNVINNEEASADEITINGKIDDSQIAAGDKVTLKINNINYEANVDSSGNFSAKVKSADLLNDSDKQIDVSFNAKDAYGNDKTINATHEYKIDIEAPNDKSTTINIDNVTKDNLLDKNEIENNVTISGKVSGEFKENDTVTINVGSEKFNAKVDVNGVFSAAVAGKILADNADKKVTATVNASDNAGNVGEITATKDYQLKNDEKPHKPTLTISEDSNGDGYINADELKGDIDIAIGLPDNAKVGDVVHIDSDNDGNSDKTINISAADIAAKVINTQIANVGGDRQLVINTWIDNEYGNASDKAQAKAIIKTNIEPVVLELENFVDSVNPAIANSDKDNISNDNNFDLAVQTPLATGDVVRYQIFDGNNWVDTNAKQQNVSDGTHRYRAIVKDIAANEKVSNEIELTIDTKAPDAPQNLRLDGDKLNGSGEAGSVVVIRDNNGKIIASKTIDSNGDFSVDGITADAADLQVNVVDIAGNQSAAGVVGRNLHVYTAASGWNGDKGPIDYGSFNTTDGDDHLQIGDGAKNKWTIGTKGNLWNANPIGEWVEVNTGAGNDIIELGVGGGGNMFARTRIDSGTGDDTVILRGGMHSTAEILTGQGNDTLEIGDYINGNSKVHLGSGDDHMTVKQSIRHNATIEADTGDDVLVAREITDFAVVNMGAGDDELTVIGVHGSSKIDMGVGDDVVTVTDLRLNPTIKLGEGDDTFIFKGKSVYGHIYGDDGNDTFVLDYQLDDSMVGNWAIVNNTNLHSKDFSGFENIEMKGYNVVDIRYQDLLNDDTRDGALFIRGGENSKVDLGNNNWNSDDGAKANLKDGGGLFDPQSWQKVGSEVVNSVSYDVYHHSSAGDAHHNDVYIQQGIVVI